MGHQHFRLVLSMYINIQKVYAARVETQNLCSFKSLYMTVNILKTVKNNFLNKHCRMVRATGCNIS